MSGVEHPAPASRSQLRDAMRVRRRALDAPARLAAAQSVRHHLDALPAFTSADRVAGYWAVNGELPLNLALGSLASRGQRYYLPRVEADYRMQFTAWHAGEAVEPNRHGIPEPVRGDTIDGAELDVVLAPLVAFDRAGGRLGNGAGYYDRAFAFLGGRARPTKPLLIGIGYGFQECPHLDTEPWDVVLDYVVTEHALIDCHAGRASA